MLRPSDIERLGPWLLAGAAGSAYLLLAFLFFLAAPELGELCDRPASNPSPGECVVVGDDGGRSFGDQFDGPPVLEKEFVRIAPPVESAAFWSGAASAAVVLAITLATLAHQRWHDLSSAREGHYRRGVGWWVAMLGIPLWAGSFGVFQATGAERASTGVVILAAGALPWIFALTSVVLIHGVYSIAVNLEERGDADRIPTLVPQLRSALALGIGVLGATLAARVLWSWAGLQLSNAVEMAELARQGGIFSSPPRAPHGTLIFSLVVTGLLGIIFSVSSSAVDRLARRFRHDQLSGLDRQADIDGYIKRRDLLDKELGLDQPMAARFQNALAVTAPMLVGVGSQLFPTA